VDKIEGGAIISKPIIYQGNVYMPCAFETSDFEINGENRLPRPKIKLFNQIGEGESGKYYFSALFQQYDPINRKIVRKTTLLKYLDDANFEGGVNPFKNNGIQRSFQDDVFFFYRRILENKIFIELEMSCSLELENVKLPQRQILSKYCPFKYRGQGCLYGGKACWTGKDSDFYDLSGATITVGADRGNWGIGKNYLKGETVKVKTDVKVFDQDINAEEPYSFVFDVYVCRQDHSSTTSKAPEKNGNFWQKDDCSKNMSACKKRHEEPIPFGGFVGTYKYSY
jgi:lambda family phage minor tail protein L